ncbi:hypothetical protein JOC59_000757 [Weissella beninensis]|uniref:Uncharacterized protein n=1 Tax=Periweissella beninensis TaxID=504936 RepID=A0ABT0VLT9_9LACO|nr:hypothetical protein [Periweissella beninensis]MBM7544051.1 hypothetical protein [Periweissella beninensis]MCM2437392.1 hypothetical protein [Periweissella beninensis]
MQGEQFLKLLKKKVITQTSFQQVIEDINIDELFTWFDKALDDDSLISGEILAKVNAEDALKLSIETSIINLPLRYQNAIDKIILADQEYELSIFAIIEHPIVSQSGLFIKKIASVKTYRDDVDAVKAKIVTFFDEKLKLIADGGWQAKQGDVDTNLTEIEKD